MMTKNSYIKIAGVFKNKFDAGFKVNEDNVSMFWDIVEKLCVMFKEDNGNFDKTRFINFIDPQE